MPPAGEQYRGHREIWLQELDLAAMMAHKDDTVDANVSGVAVVVTSTAVKRGNPEVEAALSNRVLELTPEGVHQYGGGYTEYVARTGHEAPGLRS